MPRSAKYNPSEITTIYEQKVPRSFQEATRKKLTRRSLSLITNINNAMRNRIREVLREGVAEGKSVSAVASGLLTTGLDKGVFASARKRAYLIARTELHRARQKGAVDIYKHNKISQVHWVSISDDRICDRCAGRAGRVYRVRDLTDEDFPPIHPRCRCRLLPTDFQLEIKVKHTAEGKVMETKVYPSPQNYKYIIKIKKSLDLEKGQKIYVPASGKRRAYYRYDPREKQEVFWHGSPSGELIGTHYGIHVGTFEAAREALEARIGIPAEGDWDGTRAYGKTLLAGKKTLLKIDPKGYNQTGYNAGGPKEEIPEEDYYPSQRKERAKYSGGTEVSMDSKPTLFPVKIRGGMTNFPTQPMSDTKANATMVGMMKRGTPKSGYYYRNIGEDEGSISAVVPNKEHLEIVKSMLDKLIKGLAIDEDELSREIKKVDTSPTEAEKKSGTYQKGHVDIGGLEVSIENPKGSYRSGTSKDGTKWRTQLHSHYGYIKGTRGKDKDHLDVFLGDDLDSEKVFVIHQTDPKTKEFDEHKVMLGFSNKEEAEKGYLANYAKDWKGLGSIVERTFDEFKDWAISGHTVTELEKSKQVQVKPYQRKGKYVIGYHRFDPRTVGEAFTVERMLPTQEALKTGEKLSREEILEIWSEYKRLRDTPYPEDLKEFEKRAWRTQTLREIVEGYLGSETALTPYEIDELLGIGYPFSTKIISPEAKIEKQLNPERADIRLALEVIDDISRAGGKAMIVGGFVRDALLGKPSKDLDIEVYGLSPDKLKSILENLGEVAQVGKSFGVFIFKSPELSEAIDVSLPRRESKTGKGHKGFMVEPDESMTPQEATKRRDLTINSMGYDPVKQEFIDPYNGQEDLKNKILRATDKETFGDDPLRVLRVMRFAGNLGFSVDPELVEICKGLSDSLEELPKERIYGEMEKLLLKSKIPSKGIQTIPLLGIKLFPELTDMIGVEQDDLWHPEGDVWTHTLMALDDAAKKKEQFEDPKDKMIYMLATLLHDVGKPKTPGLNEKGRITHRKHSEVGAQMAVEFMKKRLTDEDVVLSKVENLIRFHMTPTEFHKAKIADSAIRKLAKKLDIPMLVAVSSADKQGRGKSLRNKLTAERWLMKKYHTLGLDKPEALKPIVMGRHLIELGVQPGISMGKILSELYESQLSGRFDTVESGIEFARKIGLLEPIQKGFYVERNIAMKQLLELRKNKNDGKLIPMRDNGKVRWFKSYGAEGLWRKTIGAPVVGSTILIKGKLCKVTATGKDGVIARESENKYEVLYKDVELMKGL